MVEGPETERINLHESGQRLLKMLVKPKDYIVINLQPQAQDCILGVLNILQVMPPVTQTSLETHKN